MLDYLKKARELVKLYIKHNEQRLTFPEIFIPVNPPAKSPLCWNKENATNSDLYELLIALDKLGIISKDGYPAPFSQIVECFFSFLNLPCESNCYSERNRILNRATRKSVFLDKLRKSLLE